MHRVLVLGAGKIGALISGLLAESGSYQVELADVDGAAAEAVVRAHGASHLSAFALDATNVSALARRLAEHPVEAVISSLPYYCNVGVAEAARAAGATYEDGWRLFVYQAAASYALFWGQPPSDASVARAIEEGGCAA